jgi:hypothetical protein
MINLPQVRILMAGAIALLSSGCVYFNTITPAPSQTTQISTDKGTTFVTSTKESSVEMGLVRPTWGGQHSQFPILYVGIVNRTNTPIDLSPANIRISSGSNSIQIYTSEQLVTLIKQQAAQKLGYVIQDTHYEQFWPTDEALTTATPFRTPAQIEEQKLTAIEKSNKIPKGFLGEIKIRPGRSGGGRIIVNPSNIDPNQPLLIFVTLPGESHEFEFHVLKQVDT